VGLVASRSAASRSVLSLWVGLAATRWGIGSCGSISNGPVSTRRSLVSRLVNSREAYSPEACDHTHPKRISQQRSISSSQSTATIAVTIFRRTVHLPANSASSEHRAGWQRRWRYEVVAGVDGGCRRSSRVAGRRRDGGTFGLLRLAFGSAGFIA
jgi:hypothetical protein